MKDLEVLLVNEREACAMLRIGRSLFLRLVYDGEIPSIKVGKSRRYAVEALREFVARQPAQLPERGK